MIPFAPSAAAYARWMEDLSAGLPGSATPFPAVKGKRAARTLAANGRLLSVPVEGGASLLKRGTPDPALRLSQHGRWQDVHLGAWQALYGRTPYFPHLFPEMERIYREHSFGTLAEFCESLHLIVCRWLGLPEFAAQMRRAREADPDRTRELLRQYAGKTDPELSIFDTLFRYGKESVFVLAALSCDETDPQ